MYIKLNIQDELLELLQGESKEQFRSPTQQVMYILNKHYKDKLSSLKEYKSVINIQEVTKTHQEEQSVICSEYEEVILQNKELVVENKIQNEQPQEDDYGYIDDDMIDF